MVIGGKKASLVLLAGDIAAFVVSLWVTLVLRYGTLPGSDTLAPYWLPFGLLFAAWILVFYISGLYGKRIVFFKSSLPDALLKTQVANIILAALLFFFIPVFGITPKTNLIVYLLVSLALIFLWRLTLYPKLVARRSSTRAALITALPEGEDLVREVANPRYGIDFVLVKNPSEITSTEELARELEEAHISLLVVDTDRAMPPKILAMSYRLARVEQRYQFASFADVYEEVFDRVPLSLLEHGWFLENVPTANSAIYALAKRAIDMAGAILMGAITLALWPIIWIADYIEGPGPVFITQDRLGKNGTRITAYKFRSMRLNKAGSSEWTIEEKRDNPITKVGALLRLTSIDEFPQFINILFGELSLIGPRNDIEGLGTRLAEALPYYEARYLVAPGITGWAQINQQYEQDHVSPQSIEETKMRLAYDFYYLKHRSLGLDIVIALKTIKRMFFRVSSW